jgi:hypothetical protein
MRAEGIAGTRIRRPCRAVFNVEKSLPTSGNIHCEGAIDYIKQADPASAWASERG